MCKYFIVFVMAIAVAGRPAMAANDPLSASVLAFGDNNILFVGDSRGGAIFAYEVVPGANPAAQKGYNLTGFGARAAAFLHVTPDKLLPRGFAIHPASKEAYVSFDVIQGDSYMPVVLITNQSGDIRTLDLVRMRHSSITLKDANTQDFKLWSDVSLRSLTITDMKFFKGRLYVCGLSNAEFSSTLRVVDYPFTGKTSSSSIEMYHAVHDQVETRAPMRNLGFVTVNGRDYLVGSYTCTPFVAVAIDELKDGAHVTGKTLAEMAVGNTPIDLFSYTARDWNNREYPVMLLTNKHHPAELIKVADIVEAIQKDGITSPVPVSGIDKAGMPSQDIPQLEGIVHSADQDDYHIAALRRNIETGTLDLYSYLKGAWLRMDEFESEFAFPSYRYTPAKDQIRQFQGMNLKDIGKPELFHPRDK